MYKLLTVTVKGISPLIVQNGKILKDPLHPLTKTIKQFSGKRKKTDEDLEAIAKLEWYGGLYLVNRGNINVVRNQVEFDQKEGGDTPYIPGENLEAMLAAMAAKQRMKGDFKAAVRVDDAMLVYDGPKTAKGLWDDGRFRDVRDVRIQGKSSIMRYRPVFSQWSLTFTVQYLSDIVNEHQVIDAIDLAGKINGLGTYRPKYGQFDRVG